MPEQSFFGKFCQLVWGKKQQQNAKQDPGLRIQLGSQYIPFSIVWKSKHIKTKTKDGYM